MKYQDALEEYFKNLNRKWYAPNELLKKKTILRKWFSYALTLFIPSAIIIIKNLNAFVFYYHGKLYTSSLKANVPMINDLIITLNEDQKNKFGNLIAFLNTNKYDYVKVGLDKKSNEKLHTVNNFIRAIGFKIDIGGITKKIYNDSIEYLKKIGVRRSEECIKAFMLFCYENKWLQFNPYYEKKSVYARCLEKDFLGYENGKWKQYLLKYIDYLKYERNLGDGGIDYKVRKLKILVKYLDLNKVLRVKQQNLKKFVEIKASEDVKNVTLAKYIYETKYFFSFLIKQGWEKSNPALDIKIKDRIYYEGDVLNELEVNQVLEMFEDEIYKTKNAKRNESMRLHFQAVRDKVIFLLFIFTGIRLSEAGGIKLDDIDREKRSIRITGKGNRNFKQKERDILIAPTLWDALNEYLKVRHYPSQKYLFINWGGSALSNSGINRSAKRGIKKAGINKKISPHRLRATCASLYIKKGIDPLTLKIIMGHSTITTTIDKYAKLTDEEVRKIWKETNPLKGILDEE